MIMSLRIGSVLVLLAAVAAAIGQYDGRPAIRWSTFLEGQESQIKKQRFDVLVTEGDWQRFWNQMTRRGASSAPRGVNWNTEQLVAIHLGTREGSGNRVYVQSITSPRPHDVQITYVEQRPAPRYDGRGGRDRNRDDDRDRDRREVSPYVIVKMNRTPGVPRFVRVEGPQVQTGFRPNPGYGYCRCAQCPGLWGGYCGCGCSCYPQLYPYPLPYDIWQVGTNTVYDFVGNRLITSRIDFESYWTRLTGERSVPNDIDWSRDMVVAIHLGRRMTGGFGIQVVSVDLTRPGEVTVNWAERKPLAGTIASQAITSPYALVRIPRGVGEVKVNQVLTPMGR